LWQMQSTFHHGEILICWHTSQWLKGSPAIGIVNEIPSSELQPKWLRASDSQMVWTKLYFKWKLSDDGWKVML
jgi:hypothetical protein